MTRFNTGNSIDSSDPRDLSDNAKNLDQAINSGSFTFVDRTGKTRLTLRGYESAAGSGDVSIQAAARAHRSADRASSAALTATAAAEVAASEGWIYSSPGGGESERSEGDYFWVVSQDDDRVLELWLMGSSMATDTGKRTASSDLPIETARTVRSLESELDQYSLAVVDRLGYVIAGFDDDGDLIRPGEFDRVLGDESIKAVSLPSDEFAYAVSDRLGFVGNGYRADGKLAFFGESAEYQDVRYFVHRAFVEPWGDPSEALAVTWFSSSEDSQAMAYRADGTGDWIGSNSVRTRAFPDRNEWIHTAFIKNLSPDTVYEFRVLNTAFRDTFKTCKLTYPINIVHCSDYQQYNFSSSGLLYRFGEHVKSKASADLILLGGDYVNDDGDFNSTNSSRWAGFLDTVCQLYRTPGGDLIPMIAIMGNHEGGSENFGGNALWGGDGTMGQTATLFSFSYDDNDQNRFLDSASYFTVGKRLLVVTLETDHTQPLPDQFEWFKQVIEDNVKKYDSTIVVGHAPPFNSSTPSRYVIDTQARELRNRFWTLMQEYSDKIRCYMSGHDHSLAVTHPIRVMYDENQSLSDNDDNWTTAEGGIRQIGTGPWGATRRSLENSRRESNIDASEMFEFGLGYDTNFADDFDVIGDVQNANSEIWHVWFLSLTKEDMSFNAINSDGDDFILFTDTH